MARPGVTYIEVSNAAQQLIASGRAPTIETIRIALGTGSNSTLGAHLRTWKSKQDHTQQIATKENIPEELISALKGVWERVMNQSEDRVQSAQQETQQELVALKQEVQRSQKDNAHCQQQYQQIKHERDGFAHEKTVTDQLLANARIELATLLEKNAGVEQKLQEKQERIDELHRQNQLAQANLEHYRSASLEQRLIQQQRYEQHQKQFEQTILQVNQELAQRNAEKIAFQQQIQQMTFENDSRKIQLDNLTIQHESTSTCLTSTISELAKKAQDQRHWQERFQTLEARYDDQNQSLIDLKTQHAMLVQQSETMKIELKELREQNKMLAHEKWILGQEKAQLFGQLKQIESCV
jgi:hypothetical protein